MKQTARRQSALNNVAQKRAMVVNLDALVRVYLLDGSSKLLQMFEDSSVADVLIALKSNMDLEDVSTYGLFRVIGTSVRRLELKERVSYALKDPTDSGQEVRLLFRSWISYRYGVFDRCVFQEGVRDKQPNTELWLAYMEGTFMCMSGKYYLSEDESVLLGCLRMQAESGDFNPSIHTTEMIVRRVIARFPNPIRSKMKALNTETLQGNGMADLLAERIQAAYARVAGKSKIEAQIDFLSTLRTFCPFYGSTFFDVQCQYDDQPLNSTTQPPVTPMNAAVGPLAIFLMTKSNPPTVMRHPYNRIIKWIAHASKHIFTYWVIKANVRISEIEQLHSEKKKDFDIRPYCDCIYLVTSQVHEIEHVVKSYVQSASNVDPCLAGAPPELQPSATKLMSDNLVDDAVHSTIDPTTSSPPAGRTVERKQSVINITSLGMLFSSLGADVPASSPNTIIKKSGKPDILTGSGYSPKGVESEARFGDDSPGVATSMFKEAFNTSNESRSSKKKGIVDTESEPDIPSNIKYASDMAELKKVAEESQFSDDESESDENDSSDERPKSTKNQNKSTSKANASKQNNVATKDPSKQQIKSTEISSESEALLKSNGPADGKSPSQIFRRASNFFSPFAGKLNNGDVSINGSSAKAETTKTKSVDSESDAGSGSDSSNGHSSDSDTQVM